MQKYVTNYAQSEKVLELVQSFLDFQSSLDASEENAGIKKALSKLNGKLEKLSNLYENIDSVKEVLASKLADHYLISFFCKSEVIQKISEQVKFSDADGHTYELSDFKIPNFWTEYQQS